MKTWLAFLTLVMSLPSFANIDRFGRARDEEISYRIDPSACIANLVWNEDYTHAECVVDAGKPVHPLVSAIEETAGFDFPHADTYGKIRFRPNGYIVELNANQPMDPDRTLNLLGQTLAKLGPFEVSLFSPINCADVFDQ